MRKMKESGISWIGLVPYDWKIMRLKYVSDFYNGYRGSNYPSGDDLVEEGIPFLTSNNIHGETLDVSDEITKYITQEKYDSLGGAKVMKNDIIFCLRGSVGTCAINKSIDEGTVASSLVDIRPKKIDPNFLNYVLNSPLAEIQTLDFMNGSCALNLSAENVSSYVIFVPSIPEQHRISTYLDAKCAEIDALTVDIQSQIDTLEQYKRSVITETVTRGLDKDVEMKESGIDGAGETPSNWKTTRLCYECYIRARLGWLGLKADEYVDEGYAFISAFNIQNGKLVWTPLNYITKERFDESPEIKLHSGDVLIVKDGAGVGKCARVDDLPMGGTAPNSSIAVITPSKNLDYRYVCYYLQSAVFNNFVLLLYNGMGVPHLTQEVMSKIKILVPPLKEQMVISDYLDAKCTEIDDIVETKKSQLATLDEYKKSTIYEYVTGKKEVPAV